MAKRIRITPLAGIGQVGGAVLHVAHGRAGVLLDFGADLKRSESLLGSTLRPRPSRGLDDWLGLGLLPHLRGSLRDDLLREDSDAEDALRCDVESILPTHAHADHLANLWALNPEIDVHCSAITASILLSDTISSSGLTSEATHVVERSPDPKAPELLHRPRSAQPIGRSILLTDSDPTPELREMWRIAGPDDRLGRSSMRSADMVVESWPVSHSVLGSVGLILKGETDVIAHCGDLRRHGLDGELTDEFISRLTKVRPDLLVLEGTRLGREQDERTTERQCQAAVRRIVRDAGRRLVVACISPKHVERLAIFLGAARENRRKLVVPAKTMLMLEAIAAASPYHDLTDLEGLAIYDPPASSHPAWHRGVRERHAARLVRPEEIRAKQARYVFLHAHSKMLDWRDIEPYGAVYVHSSSGAYSSSAHARLRVAAEWTRLYGMRVEGVRFDKGNAVDPMLNPSGHLHPSDISELLAKVRPTIVLGVHCDDPRRFRDVLPSGTRLIIPEIGKTIRL